MTTRVGNYEILDELGRGGMGVVYKARHEGLDRVVALKMVLVGAHASDTDVRRFLIEARSVARLQHPNIVQVFEIGEDKGLPYFTLEYVDGPSLAVHMAGAPLPIPEAVRIARTIATAMQYAHDLGVLHRDIKPANILLTSGGVPKIADFGLAKLVASGGEPDAGSVKTMTGVAVGTPSYMAPEQAYGDTRLITVAADQYQVGAVLYEMLSGRPPFQSTNAIDTLRQVISADPRSLREMRVQIPADLETICLKALQKEPAQRYRSCADLASDLERFLNGEPILARRVPTTERVWRWCRRNPAVATLTATAAVLVIATAAIASWSAVTLAARNRDLAAESARAAASARDATQQAQLAQRNERQAKEQSVRAETSAREAQAQTERADASAQVARQQTGVAQRNLEEANRRSDRLKTYVQTVFTNLQQLNTAGSPQLRTYKSSMMSATLPLLEEIVAELPATGEAVPTRMRAHFELAQAAREQGDYATADRSLTQLVSIGRERVTLMAGSDASRANLVLMLRERAVVRLRFNRNLDEHIALLQEAKALAEEIVRQPRVSPQGLGRSTYLASREQIALLNQDLGAAFVRIGNSARAGAYFTDAQQGYRALIAAIPDGRAYAPDPAEPTSPVNPAPPENVRQQHVAGMRIALDRAGLALGFALANTGESVAGLALLRQAANARRTSYESDTTNFANAVAYGAFLVLTAEEEAKAGDVNGALPQLERGALLLDRAVRADPQAVDTRRNAAVAFYALGSWRETRSDARSADAFARAVVLRRQPDGKEPTDPLAQAELARAQAAAGDTVAALELAARVERLPGLDNEVRLALAKGLARAAIRQRGAGRQRTNDRATALLNEAVDNGFRDHFVLTHEPDFTELLSQARFTAVLARIRN